tara:strand:- start:1546 stop:2901 length:1356 start_codon:yes stop_codon:yes gene_type:complete
MFSNKFILKYLIQYFNIFKKKDLSRVKRNLTAQSAIIFSSSFIQILIVPIMILGWGVKNYAIWIFFMSLPSLLTFLNINFITATRQELILNINKRNRYAQKIFSNSFFFSIINIIFFLFLYSVNLIFYDSFKIFDDYKINELTILIFCTAIGYSINLINLNMEIGISCKGRIDIGVYIKNISNFFMLIVVAMNGFISNDINISGVIYLIFQVIQSIFFYKYYKKISSELNFKKKYIDLKLIKYIFQISRSYYLNTFSHILRNSGLIYIISAFFSPAIVVLISTIKTLFYFLPIRAVALVGDLAQYEYANKYKRSKYKDVFNISNIHIFLVSIFIFIFLILSLTIGPSIYNIWIINNINYDVETIFFIALDAVFIIYYGVFISVSKSINNFLKVSTIEFIIVIIAILIAFYFGKFNYAYQNIIILNTFTSCLLLIFSISVYLKSKQKIMFKI